MENPKVVGVALTRPAAQAKEMKRASLCGMLRPLLVKYFIVLAKLGSGVSSVPARLVLKLSIISEQIYLMMAQYRSKANLELGSLISVRI